MQFKTITSTLIRAVLILFVSTPMAIGASPDQSRANATRLAAEIRNADYAGDRAALRRLHGEIAPYAASSAEDKHLSARIEYWSAFALWRRAINGFNDEADQADLRADLQQALDEFSDAAVKDPAFVDAKVGQLSCSGLLAFSLRTEPTGQSQQWIAQAQQIRKDAAALEPDNPRLAWVMGPMIWYAPADRGGGQANALETYNKGLASIRSHKPSDDPLEPSWGEAELLMNLAWSNLNRSSPDLDAAEKDARAALAMVPYWHYVKDILMPQIEEAKKKSIPATSHAGPI